MRKLLSIKNILILLGLILFLACEEQPKFSDSNEILLKLKTKKPHVIFFNFKTDSFLVGKKGYKYYFESNELKKASNPIPIVLNEYFTKEDLILNNIRTITDKGELLSSKGVLKIDIEDIQDLHNIKVELKNEKLDDYFIFEGDSSDINNFSWKNKRDIKYLVCYPIPSIMDENINFCNEVGIDSLRYYEKLSDSIYNSLNLPKQDRDNFNALPFFSISSNTWINIDKLIDTPLRKDFNILCNKKDLYEDYTVYIIYENLNSFTSYYLTNDNMSIKELPITGNATGIIVTYADGKILYDEFTINKSVKSNIEISLKEIELEAFKEKLTSY